MAKITSKTEEISEVTLKLTRQEAEVLRHVLGRISGEFDGPRGITQKIYDTLGYAGVDNRSEFHGKYDFPSIRLGLKKPADPWAMFTNQPADDCPFGGPNCPICKRNRR